MIWIFGHLSVHSSDGAFGPTQVAREEGLEAILVELKDHLMRFKSFKQVETRKSRAFWQRENTAKLQG